MYRPPRERDDRIRTVLEVGLEDRFQQELGGGLDHEVPDGRNAERSLASIRFWDHHEPHRIGPVRLRDEVHAQACQRCLQKDASIERSSGGPRQEHQNWRGPTHRRGAECRRGKSCVEYVEAESWLRLCLAIELPLKAPDLLRCCEAHRQSPSPHHLRKRTRSQGHCSASITRFRRSYDSVRLLLWLSLCETLRSLLSLSKGLARLKEPPFQRAVPTTLVDRESAHVDCFPAHTAFPKWQEGWYPYCHYRGLLRFHSSYGTLDRSAAQGELCREAPTSRLPDQAAR